MAKTIKHTLNIMDILPTAGNEEEILETATQFKITFYDASYAYIAKDERTPTRNGGFAAHKENNTHHKRYNTK